VLAACRRELAARRASERQRRLRWRWSLAAAALCLVLLNAAEERSSAQRIAAIRSSPTRVAQAPPNSPPAAGMIRARAKLLAGLLRDPDAL
jgi:hypothetical protein